MFLIFLIVTLYIDLSEKFISRKSRYNQEEIRGQVTIIAFKVKFDVIDKNSLHADSYLLSLCSASNVIRFRRCQRHITKRYQLFSIRSFSRSTIARSSFYSLSFLSSISFPPSILRVLSALAGLTIVVYTVMFYVFGSELR